ncbi:MAG: hypothetical protein R3B72_09300 [Polyangiaceae bacterium]
MGLGRCTPEEVADYIEACLVSGSASSTCNDFASNHPTCKSCLTAANPSGNADGALPPILNEVTSPLINIWTCEALVRGLPYCAKPNTDFHFCLHSACPCSDPEHWNCYELATESSACGSFGQYAPSECTPFRTLTELGDLSPECVAGATDPTWRDAVAGVANVICGAP